MHISLLANLRTLLCTCLLISISHVEVVHAEDTSSAFTPLEMKWLRAGWPVLDYATAQHLPIDIIVQPHAEAGDVPFAMGVKNGRCKLVLSMRGNADAESILATLTPELQTLAIEAMTAHEVAHCWRYVHGMWHALPAGFVATQDNTEIGSPQQAMLDTRREEGFADLVGLAWTLRKHPAQYAQIHAWFEQVRADQPMPGGFHDTRVWLQLAVHAEAFGTAVTPFEQAQQLWNEGLQSR